MPSMSVTLSDAQVKALELDGLDNDPTMTAKDVLQQRVDGMCDGIVQNRVRSMIDGSDPDNQLTEEERESLLLSKFPTSA
jgi:hypothetical protein